MDLSSVRLSAFEVPRLTLAEVNAATNADDAQESFYKEQDGSDSLETINPDFEEADIFEAQGIRDIAVSDTFRASLVAGQPALQEASHASVHTPSGFALAVTPNGTAVWRYVSQQNAVAAGGRGSLLLGTNGDVLAELVAPVPGFIEPGVVIVERTTGRVHYWESVGSAVTEDLLKSGSKDSGLGSGDAKLVLGEDEIATTMAPVGPAGVVVTTSSGSLVLINLRNSLGKRSVRTTYLRSGGSGSILRMFGVGSGVVGGSAWKHIVCVSPGAQINESERLVYLANSRGDVAVCRCGVDGTASLVTDAPVGALLHSQMDMLYPNAGPSLQILDMAVSASRLNLLVSFYPIPGNSLRYYLLATLLQNDLTAQSAEVNTFGDPFAIESILRLQTYETQTEEDFCGRLLLPENESAIFASFNDALVMVEPRSAANEARWEETLSLKPSVCILGAATTAQGIALVLDSGIVEVTAKPSAARAPGASATKARLEQAVFFSRPTNPLDVERWSAYSFGSDSGNDVASKAIELSKEIADASSKYIPTHLPSLKAHLELRLDRLVRLVKFVVHNNQISEGKQQLDILGQVLNLGAALAIWSRSDSNPTTNKSQASLANELAEFSRPIEIHQWFIKNTDRIPQLLEWLAKRETSTATDALVDALVATDGVARTVEQPHPGFAPTIVSKIELLTQSVIATKDAKRLEPLALILCVAYHAGPQGVINLADLLRELASLGARTEAIALAERFELWAAYAHILGETWLSAPAGSIKQKEAEDEIRFSLDRQDQGQQARDIIANEFFGFLVDAKKTQTLLKHFVGTNREAVLKFLESRGLESVAWTVDPRHSASLLAKATDSELSLSRRKALAGLTKLAGLAEGNLRVAEAGNAELQLIAVRESIDHQIQFPDLPNNMLISHTASVLKEHKRLLTREEAIDALTMLPPRAQPSLSNIARALPGAGGASLARQPPATNLSSAFALVADDDLVRQRVLIQQLIRQTPWKSLADAETDEQRNELSRNTLWYSIARQVKPALLARLDDPYFWRSRPSVTDISETYPWTRTAMERDRLLQELGVLELEASAIAEEFDVVRWSHAITAAAALDSDTNKLQLGTDSTSSTDAREMEESTMITA